jgi:TfoX/Sxy family transcriptional regulator of competence genes
VTYDAGLVERVADALNGLNERAVRQKGVFSGRGFLVGKTTFVIVWRDKLLVKTPKSEYTALLDEPGIAPFAPDGERPMSTWLVVDGDVIADDPQLTEWVRRGLRAIREHA